MGELSGQAREAIAVEDCPGGLHIGDDLCLNAGQHYGRADRALAARLGDGRTVGEWLDEAAVAERFVWSLLRSGIPWRNDKRGFFVDPGENGEWVPLDIIDPPAAALLARLGSGGGVTDGEGDVG